MSADLLHLPRAEALRELERRLAAGGLGHLPPSLRAMLGGRPKVRYDPPACATLALSNEHFAVVMAAASTVPLESRRWFFEAVALSLRGAPITDVAVSAALEQAVEVWGAAQD